MFYFNLILIASRPPAAPQGFRDLGLLDCKFTIEALKKTRAKTQTQTQKHTNSSRSASEWHLKNRQKYFKNDPWRASGESKMSSWSSLGR